MTKLKFRIGSYFNSLVINFTLLLLIISCNEPTKQSNKNNIPNFLILMADNQSWNHVGCYGDPILRTPNIDKLAKDGIRFTNAYCSAPSCAPARASMLTGQDIWRLGEAANLWSSFPKKLVTYTNILQRSGFLVGYEGKGWGPGDYVAGGLDHNPAGHKFNSFEEFYNEKDRDQPFCYWFSSRDPHRPYRSNGWKNLAVDPDSIEVPPYLPDVIDVKKDIGDYYAEIENFDRDVGMFLELLNEMGELDNTLVIVCSDNGWQMPRGLANLYDFGTKIPLIISQPSNFKGNRVVDDFVSLNDVAPTLLEMAGLPIPKIMNANSLLPILSSEEEGKVSSDRNFIVTARERHAYVRAGGAGYGGRAYRTDDYLYIRNYEPNHWPAGDPPLYGDVDAHMLHYPCPTKMYILENKDKDDINKLFELGFGKRPMEELYDLQKDPYLMNNVAQIATYKNIKSELSYNLTNYLKENGDPRELGGEMEWIGAPYYAEKDFHPKPSEEAQIRLNLKAEYSYMSNTNE